MASCGFSARGRGGKTDRSAFRPTRRAIAASSRGCDQAGQGYETHGGGTEVATANLRNARRREAMAVLAFKATLIGIVDAVIGAYRRFALAKRQVDIDARSLERAREQLAVNRLLIQTGRMAERDAIQTEADIANRELRLTETQNSLDAARLGTIPWWLKVSMALVILFSVWKARYKILSVLEIWQWLSS